MNCEKCTGSMEPRRLFRLSGCLVAGGYALIITSVVALVFGVLLAVVGPGATRGAASAHDTRAKSDAIATLEKIPSLPRDLIEELEAKDSIAEESLATLPFDQQSKVRTIMIAYHGKRASCGIATIATAGVGGFFALLLVGFGIPASIVGLLLVRRRKVWRCAACGIAFERT